MKDLEDGDTTVVVEIGGAIRVLTGTVRNGEFMKSIYRDVTPAGDAEVFDAMKGYGHADELAAEWRAKMTAVTVEQIQEHWVVEEARMILEDAETYSDIDPDDYGLTEEGLARRRVVIEGIKAGEGR